MRIAICIAGYMRSYEELFNNFSRFILNPIKEQGHSYDIFISTYDELNSKSSFSYKEGANFNYKRFNLEHIRELYNPKSINVENFDSISEVFNIQNFDRLIDLNKLNHNIHDNGILFGLSMHYKRYLCNQLKIQYEMVNLFKYDLVLLIRPDIFWLKPLNVESLDKNKIYCRDVGYDYFFISSSENIDKICDVHMNIENICKENKDLEFNGFPLYCPEFFLEKHLNNIKISDLRVGLGEDCSLLCPRNNFGATAYALLQKFNRLNEWDSLFNQYD